MAPPTPTPMPNQQYWVYLAANVDPFNFNAINPATNRPWGPGDDGAETHYNADRDLRLRPFLSLKAPDHGRLSEQWPGYFTRHIGQAQTDANGRFINSTDLSVIRQPTLNPEHFSGLAEVMFVPVSESEFMVARVSGTSGIVMVGGEPIQAYVESAPEAHRISVTDHMQLYREAQLDAPLLALNPIETYPDHDFNLFMANSRPFWGEFVGRCFVTSGGTPPQGGLLSPNWPGNQARWLATIRTDSQGRFTGSFIKQSAVTAPVTIDDQNPSLNTVYSGAKVESLVQQLTVQVSLQSAYDRQVAAGIAGRLFYVNSISVRFEPTDDLLTVVFPNLATREIDAAGLELEVEGEPGTLYYVYLDEEDFFMSATPPNEVVSDRLSLLGNAICVGYVGLWATDALGGDWSVYSAWNQPARQYTADVGSEITYLGRAGIVIPPGKSCTLGRNGYTVATAYCGETGCQMMLSVGSLYCWPVAGWARADLVISLLPSASAVPSGVYGANDIYCSHALYWSYTYYCPWPALHYTAFSGKFFLNLEGS